MQNIWMNIKSKVSFSDVLLVLLLVMMLLGKAIESSATPIPEGPCGQWECVETEVHETTTTTTTEENVTYTETETHHTEVVWHEEERNSDWSYGWKKSSKKKSVFDRHWNKDGSCVMTIENGQNTHWADRWSENDDTTSTDNGNTTTYTINDVDECNYIRDDLNRNSNRNRGGSGYGSGNNNYGWWETLTISSWMSTYNTTYETTTSTFESIYTTLVCTWIEDGGETPSEPVPEPATMLLFGTGLAGLAALRKLKEK